MSYHINIDFSCSKCGAFYIPYDEVICPKCGYYEEMRFDLISEIVRSLRINKNEYGKYQPPAWWEGSFGDYIIRVMYSFLDDFNLNYEDALTFVEYVDKQCDTIKWEHEYHKKYMKDIAIEVYDELNKKDSF